MATLGIAYFLDGFGQTLFGSDIYKIDVGMPKDPVIVVENVFQGGILINKEDSDRRADRGGAGGSCWRCSSRRPSTGRALRAVADDHQAAQSIGIPLKRIWVIVWSVAGFVALVAGMIWGSKLGVQFSLSLVALKALPVVILGGLTSVPGAIIGGLIIGVGEKLSEVYLGPDVGRRHRDLVRLRAGAGVPAGPAARAVRRKDHRPRVSAWRTRHALPRKRPVQDQLPRRPADLPDPAGPHRHRPAAAGRPSSACRCSASDYLFRAILIPFLILSLAALGLNILVGYCGQISLGTGAFMAVGAYARLQLLRPHRRACR